MTVLQFTQNTDRQNAEEDIENILDHIDEVAELIASGPVLNDIAPATDRLLVQVTRLVMDHYQDTLQRAIKRKAGL